MNNYLPINKEKLIKELKEKGIDDNNINNIDWTKCIKEDYCSYINKKGFICLTKKKDKTIKFCKLHNNENNEIEIIEENIKNISIKDEKSLNKCFYLDDLNIDKLYIKTKELTNIIKNYKEGNTDINQLSTGLINYNNLIYETEKEPYISISYFLQMLEEVYETSNCFFDTLFYDTKINNDYNLFLETCEKWKSRMKEIFNEINILPEYYKEYYIIINNKIDNNLFKINKNMNYKIEHIHN